MACFLFVIIQTFVNQKLYPWDLQVGIILERGSAELVRLCRELASPERLRNASLKCQFCANMILETHFNYLLWTVHFNISFTLASVPCLFLQPSPSQLMALCPNFNKSVNVSCVSVICCNSLDAACHFNLLCSGVVGITKYWVTIKEINTFNVVVKRNY